MLYLLNIIKFAMMTGRDKMQIRTLLAVGYSDMLTRVRKTVKGLRTQHLYCIMLVGDNLEQNRCIDYAKITGKSKDNIYQRLIVVIESGYVYKENKRYYLTDSGQLIYDTICREFDTSMKIIIAALAEEAKKHL